MRTHRAARLIVLLGLLSLGGLLRPSPATAQDASPRFGVGFALQPSTSEILGFGLRARVSAPVNSDLSLAADVGFTGFLLRGRDEATYIFDPQVSAIVTLPYETDRAPYILAGLGAYAPFESEDDEHFVQGPTLHGGVGWVQVLRETTLFYEVNPILIIGQESVGLAIPLRLGVIF